MVKLYLTVLQYHHMKLKGVVLVTGGAGFIGSFLVDHLIGQGRSVRIFDNLEAQVHRGKKPRYLHPKAEFIKGDVRDYEHFAKALENVDVVYHLAARVGVGQSNYEIKHYTDVNIGGTANLLDIVVNKGTSVKKIILAASMSSYGEGMYRCPQCGIIQPPLRHVVRAGRKQWDVYCPTCGNTLAPVPTTEEAKLTNNSIYSLTKSFQEQMVMHVGNMYQLPVVSLRFFNVYGPRQSLSNPYTGVAAIFVSRLKHNKPPIIYEDGKQTRDFVSVHDVVRALVSAAESQAANFESMNIGSGKATTIMQIAQTLAALLGKTIQPTISQKFRKNDVKHCFADIAKAKRLLRWAPTVSLEQGLRELIDWSTKEAAEDLFEKAEHELKAKSLL